MSADLTVKKTDTLSFAENHSQISKRGYPVSKELSDNKFSALGDNWWKQIYDGKYHSFGKMVFDEGLHKKKEQFREPGFYESAWKAFQYAKENLSKKVTVEVYHHLHKLACSHFKGEANNTGMLSSQAGIFRNPSEDSPQTMFSVADIVAVLDRNSSNFAEKAPLFPDFKTLRVYHGDKLSYESTLDEFKQAGKNLSTFVEFESLLNSNFENFNKYIEQVLEVDPSLKNAFPKIELYKESFRLYHRRCDFLKLIEHIFEKFNKGISEIDTQLELTAENESNALIDRKLTLIADLYQKLEWFHPFRDGQGRTDLIFLSKLLCANGFTPFILEEPYVSSFVPLKEWVQYLKEGMQLWNKLLNNPLELENGSAT